MKFFCVFLLLVYQAVDGSHQRPMDAMADLTNDLGVCILQVLTRMQEGNMVFSPYGIASVSVLLFEGSSGNTALEILRVLNLPWNALLARIGFRDMNRHLKTYFKSDGFLRGLIMSKDEVCFHYNYQKILRLYGFEEPERALTYPCHGFTSYTPDSMAHSTTESSVSVTSSSDIPSTSNGTTPVAEETPASTELSTNAENIVTELTQTSQTIMLFNTTTSSSLNATDAQEVSKAPLKETTIDGMNTDTTMLRTEILTLPQQSTLAGELLTTIATLSSTQSSVDVPEKFTEPAPTTEITEMSQKNEVTLPPQDKSIEPSGSETILVPISSPLDSIDYSLSESAPNSTLIKPGRFNASRSLKHRHPSISKASREILQKEMKKIIDKYKHKNFTNINDIINEIEKDFKSNSSESSFPEDLLDDLLASTRTWNSSENSVSLSGEFEDISDFFSDNFTSSLDEAISSSEILKNILNATRFRLFNDTFKKFNDFDFSNKTFDFSTEKFDYDLPLLELTPFNYSSTPFFNSTDENSKELSSFYNTVVGFFENATQSFKDYFTGFSTSTVSPSVNPFDGISITTTSLPKSDTNTTSVEKPNNGSTPSTLLSKDDFNKSSEFTTESGDHVLPKKSISGKNERVAAESQNLPNYVNVLSLRQSKLTETKFNIKGPHKPKKVFKRDINAKTSDHKQHEEFDVSNTIGINPASPEQRQVRSFVHDKVESYRAHGPSRDEFDWFTVFDSRSTIYIPTFTYSAYLPFAYIDDLKSKVLEIPLDDSQYSLLILLPTHRYGLNYLLTSLSNWPVRKIHRQLRPTSVYAIIPKFRVLSHVDLKPALYALGMKDIFYRYRADLSVMSPDARLFVRSIEQVVTVHVDKYPNAVYEVPEKLVEHNFAATHPFIYFVIDRESKVSLVTGIMADPSKQQITFL